MESIKYREGFKYQLAEDYVIKTNITPAEPIDHDFISLSSIGVLRIKAGYAWDGCSGPTVDDKTNMRAGLVHDALYQLMREGLLPKENRELADQEFERICLEDGMNRIRAFLYYKAVRTFASKAADPRDNTYPIQTAP